MVETFIEEYAKIIASKPDRICVQREIISKEFSEITIFADSSDVGKLIGKNGKMIGAIKSIISGCKAKDSVSYRVIVKNA
jgi:uncharacterized protein